MKKGKTLHMSVNFRFVELQADETLAKWIKDGVLVGDTIKTAQDARNSIRWMRAKGLEVFPPCDNTDEKGRCAGH